MPHPQIDADRAGFFDEDYGFALAALSYTTPTDPSPVSVSLIEVDEVERFEDGDVPVDGTRKTVHSYQTESIDYNYILEWGGVRYEVVGVDKSHAGYFTYLVKRVS